MRSWIQSPVQMRKEKENSVLLIVFYFRWRLDSSNRPVFTPEWQCGQHRKCWARSRARSRARSLHSSCSHDLDSCANFLVSLTSILLVCLFLLLVVLAVSHTACHVLGTCSMTELYPQSFFVVLFLRQGLPIGGTGCCETHSVCRPCWP